MNLVFYAFIGVKTQQGLVLNLDRFYIVLRKKGGSPSNPPKKRRTRKTAGRHDFTRFFPFCLSDLMAAKHTRNGIKIILQRNNYD